MEGTELLVLKGRQWDKGRRRHRSQLHLIPRRVTYRAGLTPRKARALRSSLDEATSNDSCSTPSESVDVPHACDVLNEEADEQVGEEFRVPQDAERVLQLDHRVALNFVGLATRSRVAVEQAQLLTE